MIRSKHVIIPYVVQLKKINERAYNKIENISLLCFKDRRTRLTRRGDTGV